MSNNLVNQSTKAVILHLTLHSAMVTYSDQILTMSKSGTNLYVVV